METEVKKFTLLDEEYEPLTKKVLPCHQPEEVKKQYMQGAFQWLNNMPFKKCIHGKNVYTMTFGDYILEIYVDMLLEQTTIQVKRKTEVRVNDKILYVRTYKWDDYKDEYEKFDTLKEGMLYHLSLILKQKAYLEIREDRFKLPA